MMLFDAPQAADRIHPLTAGKEDRDEVKVEDARGTKAALLATVPAMRFCHPLTGRAATTWRGTALIANAAIL